MDHEVDITSPGVITHARPKDANDGLRVMPVDLLKNRMVLLLGESHGESILEEQMAL